MPLPRIQPIPAQPQPQQIPLPIAFAGGSALTDVVNPKLPTITNLNGSVTSAVPSNSTTDIIGTLKIAYGIVTFTTSANIAAGTNVWTIVFAVPFVGVPVVTCSGGALVNSWEAWFITSTQCLVYNVNALGTAAGQSMQWIAIGH